MLPAALLAVLVQVVPATAADGVELKGQLTVEKGVAVPRELEATFDLKGDRVTVVCPIDGKSWTCRLPRTKLDVRLAAKGFAPQYLWDVELPQTRPVTIALKRGASVAGWVSAERRDVPLDAAIVKLVPVTYGEPAEESLVTLRAKPNGRGFFQFTGVPAGRWIIAAEAPDRSPSPIAELEVDEHDETTLRDPLLLRDLADLAVSIEPATDARGVAWRVRLNRRDPHSRYQKLVVESAATEAGEWAHARLAAGEYDIDVVDVRGAVHAAKRIIVAPEMPPLRIEIERVPVQGTLRVGGDGIAATLKFSSNRGEAATVATKDDGEFTIDLPFEGKWRVDVRLRDTKQELAPSVVRIARKDGESYARVELDLPSGRIAGRVVDESGRPTRAGVILTRRGSLLADILAENGTFELVGVEPGPAMIEAQAKGSTSGLLPVNIDVDASPITLTLRALTKLEGFLMTSSGDPVAGASIRYLESGAAFRGDVVTSPTGRFVIELSADTTAVRVAIAAPGLPTKLALLRVPENGEAVEVVMGRASGRLVVSIRDQPPPWPSLGRDGAWAPLFDLVPPYFGGSAPPRWATKQGMAIDLEPGEYTLCPTNVPSADCVTHVVTAGTTIIADTPRRREP